MNEKKKQIVLKIETNSCGRMACTVRTADKFEGSEHPLNLLPRQALLGVTWQMTPSYHFSSDFRNKVNFKIKTIILQCFCHTFLSLTYW